jgi:CBS domain-containing protein
MHAGEIAERYPVVGVDMPGLVVAETDGTPKAVLPASQVVRFMVPDYVQQDPGLARAIGEKAADRIADRLRTATVGQLLPERPGELAVLKSDDTVLELAAVMARLRSPLCAVVADGKIVGVVTAARLLAFACGTPS